MKHLVLSGAIAVCIASAAGAAELRLIDVIKDQNHKVALAMIAAHADVNAPLPDGSTPLAWAAYQDDSDIAAALIKAGAKIDPTDQYGETPLTLACANGNAAIVEMLIKGGANVNAERWSGESALMIAAGSGNPRVMKMLLDHDARVGAVESRKGQNALMWATANGHPEAVDLLLKAGADPNTASKSGFTPLIFSAERGDVKSAASLLAAKADVNHELPGGMNPLLIAVTAKKAEVAGVLIAGGASVGSKDRTGNTALHIAAQLGEAELVKDLIAKGADVNAKTAKAAAGGGRGGGGGGFGRGPAGEQTPLMLAARANKVDIMHALVAAGADPKLRAQDGSTLLMAAANSGHVEVVQYAYELDPSEIKAATDSKAEVMHASVTGSMALSTQPEICKVVQFLADKGATLDPVDANGRTPIIIADVLPIDDAVALLTKLIKASGAEPHVKTKR
jgi:ankyrin repeat protein